MSTPQKRAVVTGGAGFIGSHVVDALIEAGYDVNIVDNMSAGKRERVHPKAKLFEVDVCDTEAFRAILRKGDIIFHLAALPSVPYSILHPRESHEVNVGGTLSVLEAAREMGAARVVYSASSAAYGDNPTLPLSEVELPAPVNPYGVQKYANEHHLRIYSILHGIETVSLRYFNVYGPRMNLDGPYAAVIGAFVKRKQQGLPMRINGDGGQTRDFVHVTDVARANFLAATAPTVGRGEVVNIGSGKSISVKALAHIMGGDIEYAEAVKEARHSLADNRKAKTLLGWEPTVEFEDGIAELLREWGF